MDARASLKDLGLNRAKVALKFGNKSHSSITGQQSLNRAKVALKFLSRSYKISFTKAFKSC